MSVKGSNMCVFVILGVLAVITRCEDIAKLNHRESCGTSQRPWIQSQGSLSCARVLSGGERNLTESELWERID